MIRCLNYSAILASVALVAVNPAVADVKAGVDAWSRGDYSAAIREWRPLADKGDADAQFNLAQAYKLGRGVDPDLDKAQQWFEKAAAHGHLQAADNLGLILFQKGERARAMPYIRAASDRGDPRAQYILGLATFNGDTVPKDWVQAYALVRLSQQAGLPQAKAALTQMDQYIPLDQRQKGIARASELAAQAKANRESQLAAVDLGATLPELRSRPSGTRMATNSAAAAGADFASSPASIPAKASPPAAKPHAAATSAKAPSRSETTTAVSATGGPWRIQLGAFGVAGNAEGLWNRVKSRKELAGHARILTKAGKLTVLQADGFASRNDAKTACSHLASAGFACLPVRK